MESLGKAWGLCLRRVFGEALAEVGQTKLPSRKTGAVQAEGGRWAPTCTGDSSSIR